MSGGVEGELILIRDHAAADAELETQLRALGAPVTVLAYDQNTVDEVVRREPALVVLDVPHGTEGLVDLPPRIAARFGATCPAVLVVMDADEDALIERAFAQGAKDVLTRPVSAPLLRAKVLRNARRPEPTHAVGGYAIERVLGRGGMGTVYLAERDGQRYALKVLELGPAADMEALARFRREMETLRGLSGPGIPRFYEAGRTGDAFFYVMEYFEGETLAQALARAPLEEAALRTVIIDIARALRVIHAADLVHRDVKPGNIILTPEGRATLVDYGLTKLHGDFSLTRRDEVLGTILYIAPEVLRGEDAGAASDAFALGMTVLHAALGFDPLDGTAAHIARRIMLGDVPRATERLRGLTPDLTEVIDGLLERDATKRLALADAQRRLAPEAHAADEELAATPERELGIERTLVLALTFLDGETEGRRVEFRPPRRIVLGRSKEADVEVFDAKVSRRHCTIGLEAHGAHVKDLGSANGTFLNGAQVMLAALNDGDRLRVADTHMRVELTDRTRTVPLTGAEVAEHERSSGELHVPGYELLRRVGAGSSASVFEARSQRTGETFAIKITRPLVAPAEEDRKRFLREAATASALVHPNIVRIYERGEFAGSFFLVMEYVLGETLQAYISRTGPLPVSFALHVARQIASALELARTCGIVHRDVKPENILLQQDGTAKLADFGLAKSILGAGQSGTTPEDALGTLSYMAPEQIRSSVSVDHRADIYSLGATLYHMLAGSPPFAGESRATAFLSRVFDEEPPPIARKDLPPIVAHLVQRCLKKKPEDRPKTAGDIVRLAGQLLSTVEQKKTVSDY